MTTDQTEAATRARMAERAAFARGARAGSEAEAAAPPPKQPPYVAIGSPWPGGYSPYSASGSGSFTATHTVAPPPPPHVEQSSPSLNPFAALGRLISGVNVPPVLVGMARGVVYAAAFAALEAVAADLKGAHIPVEYAALVPVALLAVRSIEGGLDSWGKGG